MSLNCPSNLNNALWRIRKKRGMALKQVAWLLGHRSSNLISSYERGERSPNLETALKLAVIYRCDIRELFPEHYESFRIEVAAKAAKLPGSFSAELSKPELVEVLSICTFEQLLEDPNVTEEDARIVRKHVTKLARIMAHL